MSRARAELGCTPAVTCDDALLTDLSWAAAVVAVAAGSGQSWHDVFPGLPGRYGAACWFPCEAEDACVASLPIRS